MILMGSILFDRKLSKRVDLINCKKILENHKEKYYYVGVMLKYASKGGIMKATRNLFLLIGERTTVGSILKKLSFKGLVTAPLGTKVDNNYLDKVFDQNKSVVCYSDDYVENTGSEKTVQERRIYRIYTSKIYNQAHATILEGNEEPIEKQFARVVSDFGCDIGDLKSNVPVSSDETASKATCAYCRYQNGYAGGNDRIIYQNNSFFVLATFGQFDNGQLIIIPNRHIMSNAELTAEELVEFKEALEDVEYLIKLTYSKDMILVWENGSGTAGKTKAKDSVVHAHVHVYPSVLTAEEVEETSGLKFKDISLNELEEYADVPYLLIRSEENHDVWKICPTNDVYVPRQYIRAYVAEKMGIKDETWNWRKYPFHDRIRETVLQIRDAVIANQDKLPERVRKNTACLL